ncbi:MerR family transcriptional regulator [Desulforamulus ferrireducens]|uniref:MerR family transcriptional regulator n=1 Tax=Desulforamulus ferrireducens TaxID=1833852 RepID=A0A1S6J0R8_9FIRM|nr:MerR family transcriptional regulator [Desulforamulus ferrireducens]
MAILYNNSRGDRLGELKKYKIGELAELAGVSRRTIDYYTNLGLLVPERSQSGYRYYTENCLLRLKLIESMKNQRLTLEEIKERMGALTVTLQTKGVTGSPPGLDLQFLKEQVKQLEIQLAELQPLVSKMEAGQAVASRQAILRSIALMQSLILYLSELTPYL